MSRLMSVAFTEAQVRARTKTVTRRKGWWTDRRGRRLVIPGDTLTLCRKVMGRKPGEPLVRICNVEIVDVRREPLMRGLLVPGELEAEGFPDLERRQREHGDANAAAEFIDRYFTPQRIGWNDYVTRIAWRYLDGGTP